MRTMGMGWVAALLAVGLAVGVCASEQPQMVTFSGLVVGPNGAALPSAPVEVHYWRVGDDHEVRQSVDMLRTDAAGAFRYTLPADDSGWPGYVNFCVSVEGLALSTFRWIRSGDGKATITLYEPARLAGTVVDEAGNGVAGAEVQAVLHSPQSAGGSGVGGRLAEGAVPRATTDQAGRFVFTNIPPDATAEFVVRAPGKGTVQTGRINLLGTPLQFAAGREDVRVVVRPEAIIRGVAVDADTGAPIEGQTLEAWGACERTTCVSGKDGAFEFIGVSRGRVNLRLRDPGHDVPGWTMPGATVEVEAGQTMDGLRVECSRAGILSVTVIDAASHQPIAGALVEGYPAKKGRQMYGNTYTDGRRSFHAMPGAYQLKVTKPGHRDFGLEEIQIVAGEVSRLTVELASPPEVKGVVLDPAGRPVEGASVTVDKTGSWEHTDEDGLFQVSLGRGINRRWDKGHVFALWVEAPGRDLAIVQDLAGGPQTLRVVLRPYRTVSGRAVDPEGAPIRGAKVTLRWKGMVSETKTDADGRYEFRRLPLLSPDQPVHLAAEAGGRVADSLDPLVGEAQGERVAIGDLVLAPAPLSIVGVVVDAQGVPVGGVQVEAYRDGWLVGQAMTGAGGNFLIPDLSAGNVQLYMPGSPNPEPMEVAAGRTDVRLVQWAAGSKVPENPPHRVP